MKRLSLVILAAGMWTRYGWLKQIDEFGPHGESLLEYAVYDAVKAWFDHIVYVIREDFADAFRDKFQTMLDACPSYDIVYQVFDPDFDHAETVTREKPRGTLHATLSAQEVIDNPFAVINADDRYGTRSYQLIADRLQTMTWEQSFLVWYVLGNTLSDHGAVNRWVCDVQDGKLMDVVETYKIAKVDEKIADQDWQELTGDEIVSMNFRGFHQNFLDQATELFHWFVTTHADQSKAEMPIPPAVDQLIHDWVLSCEVIQSPDSRQWVTNAEDKPRVQEAFDQMMQDGVYPEKLREEKKKS